MGKQFNEWLDGFVENGADASDVTKWPEYALASENSIQVLEALANVGYGPSVINTLNTLNILYFINWHADKDNRPFSTGKIYLVARITNNIDIKDATTYSLITRDMITGAITVSTDNVYLADSLVVDNATLEPKIDNTKIIVAEVNQSETLTFHDYIITISNLEHLVSDGSYIYSKSTESITYKFD